MRGLVLGLILFSAAGPALAGDGHVVPKAASVADFLDCMREHKATMVTAHRGGVVGGLPENSMEAMAHTVANIPTLLEVDVQITKDGVLVLMHDDDVSRTTDGVGNIQDMTFAQVQALTLFNHAGLTTGAKVPTLDQALEWARGKAVLQLDVKRGVPLEAVAAAVGKAKAQSYALVIIYNQADAVRLAKADPTISMNVNLFDLKAVDALAAAGVDLRRVIAFTGVNKPTPDYWSQLHARGVSAGYGVLWQGDMEIATSGDEARYAGLANAGVDIVVTDRHFEAWRAIDKRQDTRAALKACTVS